MKNPNPLCLKCQRIAKVKLMYRLTSETICNHQKTN